MALSRSPLLLTPTGPVLERPNPHLPGHCLALLSSFIRIEEATDDFPDIPEGMRRSEWAIGEGSVA